MRSEDETGFIDEEAIENALRANETEDAGRVRAVLDKALELKGLTMAEAAALAAAKSPALTEEIFDAARRVKDDIYGSRLVLFAPLYFSNLCQNDCPYCAFQVSNKDVARRALDAEEIAREVEALIDQGHKRLLLVAGESYPGKGIDYVLESIEAVYRVKRGNGEIRRVNVNVAPLTVEQFRDLKAARIGTYQLFQETYRRRTYGELHNRGPKRDYAWRLTAMDRAMEAGIDDVGLGALFGLDDWRFELLALLSHAAHLEERFGAGCHTVSVPRMEPAVGSGMSLAPPRPVSDADFFKLVAILRLAAPYTGIIMSTRESAAVRRESYGLGVSQISAGSRTTPGGYAEQTDAVAQFQLGDHRSLDEVVRDASELGYTPSFCTACYRMGRTGKDFMDLAKPGLIRRKCAPNALSTFLEYLLDYASQETRQAGERRIAAELGAMEDKARSAAMRLLEKVRTGLRDCCC